MKRFIFSIYLLMVLLATNLVNCDTLGCLECCPLLPNDCHDYCNLKGFKKGECVGGVVKDECFCSD